MKKILFLFILCIIKLNAYYYEVSYNPNPINSGTDQYQFVTDETGYLRIKRIWQDGHFQYYADFPTFYNIYGGIKSERKYYIQNNVFQDYYKNDLIFLNDLYNRNSLQPFLNYLYNENGFSANNYIQYDDYEILYNDQGLAIESIVDGVWAGLYDDNQKSKSGALYNENGSMVYYNGKAVTATTSFLVWLQKFTNKVVLEAFEEIHRSLVAGIIAAVVLVLAIVRFVLELMPSSISPRRRRYYGGGRGSLPDYGDGSQVAASVRARLAAKNRALKARAYDRSGVEQSLQNSILFDLENDR